MAREGRYVLRCITANAAIRAVCGGAKGKGQPMANKHARLGPAIFDVSVFHGIAGESIPYNDYVGCEIYWGGGGYSQRKLWLQATSEGYYWKEYSKQEKRKENSFMILLRTKGKRI